MYSTCLFCNQSLGSNEAIEQFPVGRRLAFDEAKGRLWVVCRKCERWNLTPLEQRWEAIEQCERAFSGTKLRVSTDHIGLARLKEGIELIRIGSPLRPEMAAWRYGDQFGRRRRKHIAMIAGASAVGAAVVIGGPMSGLIGVSGLISSTSLVNAIYHRFRQRFGVNLTLRDGSAFHVTMDDLNTTHLLVDSEGIHLRVPTTPRKLKDQWMAEGDNALDLHGDDAIHATRLLLPAINRGGGSAAQVRAAVDVLEGASSLAALFHEAAMRINRDREHSGFLWKSNARHLKGLAPADLLALEMATHEESERRALEGELHTLEAAWKSAEEIAGISDDMFLPADIDERLDRLKKGS